ncbi:hypothetical protein [Desulfovibrio brasiliensis]
MADVKKMPAGTCRHYVKGRCLYEELLNPGYQQDWRCVVMLRWEEAFDEFLHRAEAFGVEHDRVARLWEARFKRLAGDRPKCERFRPAPDVDPPCCLHHHEALCLLGLPECEGRCRHYRAKDVKTETEP